MTYKITPRLIGLLRNELKRNGNNTAALARKIGVHPSYIFKYMQGKVKSVQADTWEKLCLYFPEVDERPMVVHGNAPSAPGSFRYVPAITSEVVADANRVFYVPIADYALENPGRLIPFANGEAGDFAIEVVGAAMLPWYPAGTILLVRPNIRLSNGDPVVAVLNDGEVVFRIFYETEGKVTLASLDGDEGHTYQFEKNDFSPVKAVYKVIQSVRDETAILQALRERGLLQALDKYERD